MSQLDIPFILVIMLVLIVGIGIMAYLNTIIYPEIMAIAPENVQDEINMTQQKVNTVHETYNQSFGAIFIIACIVSVLLTVLLQSHPVFLVFWLLFNMATLVVWDAAMEATVYTFRDSELDVGAMDTAMDFAESGMPLWIIGANVLMAVVMLGKRMAYG